MTILDEIFRSKRREVTEAMRRHPEAALAEAAAAAAPGPDFTAALRSSRPALIAEVKRRSPSKGALNAIPDPVELAVCYARHGAAAVSVLTNAAYFGGSLEDLTSVSTALAGLAQPVPTLRKDFVFCDYQLLEARAAGASAVLLIAAMLPKAELVELMSASAEIGLVPLVETHTIEEVEAAVAAGAGLIGINNRDLHTFEVDLGTTARLRPHVPAGRLVVSESGVRSREDVLFLLDSGADAVLVGEALVRGPDPGATLDGLRGAR